MGRGRCWVEIVDGRVVRILRSWSSETKYKDGEIDEYPRLDATREIREAVFKRSGGECEWCGKIITWNFHMDEKIPRSKGGEVSLENSQALCAECHIGPLGKHSDRQWGGRKI